MFPTSCEEHRRMQLINDSLLCTVIHPVDASVFTVGMWLNGRAMRLLLKLIKSREQYTTNEAPSLAFYLSLCVREWILYVSLIRCVHAASMFRARWRRPSPAPAWRPLARRHSQQTAERFAISQLRSRTFCPRTPACTTKWHRLKSKVHFSPLIRQNQSTWASQTFCLHFKQCRCLQLCAIKHWLQVVYLKICF